MVKEKKSAKKKKGKKLEEEKVCEIFEIDKDKKEKEIVACGTAKFSPPTKEQIEKENKILRNVFIGIAVFVVFIAVFIIIGNSMKKFEYEGVKFEIVDEIAPYRTSFALYSETTRQYTGESYFYLRNDPRKLAEEVDFKGTLILLENFVINATEDFDCGGDGIIGVANMIIPLNVLGANITTNKNAVCDHKNGKYIFVNIEKGDVTEVRQTNVTCYSIRVADCEILKATERFMLETILEANKYM